MNKRTLLRRRAGLSQVQMERLTGISDAQISRWERGEVGLREPEVEKIVRVIHQALNYFPLRLTLQQLRAALKANRDVAELAALDEMEAKDKCPRCLGRYPYASGEMGKP